MAARLRIALLKLWLTNGYVIAANDVLPILGLQLGNPTVRFTETDTGRVSVMSNGTWLVWRRR
jgi:hypothetical protein